MSVYALIAAVWSFGGLHAVDIARIAVIALAVATVIGYTHRPRTTAPLPSARVLRR